MGGDRTVKPPERMNLHNSATKWKANPRAPGSSASTAGQGAHAGEEADAPQNKDQSPHCSRGLAPPCPTPIPGEGAELRSPSHWRSRVRGGVVVPGGRKRRKKPLPLGPPHPRGPANRMEAGAGRRGEGTLLPGGPRSRRKKPGQQTGKPRRARGGHFLVESLFGVIFQSGEVGERGRRCSHLHAGSRGDGTPHSHPGHPQLSGDPAPSTRGGPRGRGRALTCSPARRWGAGWQCAEARAGRTQTIGPRPGLGEPGGRAPGGRGWGAGPAETGASSPRRCPRRSARWDAGAGGVGDAASRAPAPAGWGSRAPNAPARPLPPAPTPDRRSRTPRSPRQKRPRPRRRAQDPGAPPAGRAKGCSQPVLTCTSPGTPVLGRQLPRLPASGPAPPPIVRTCV